MSARARARVQVQAELRSLLSDTVKLTQKLQSQVTELRAKGWNAAQNPR